MGKRENLAALAIRYEGEWTAIANALIQEEEAEETIRDPYLTIYDADYPDALRALRYPPWVLFYHGDKSLLKQRMITIVGSRKLSSYGRIMTDRCASLLSQKYVIVSGLARGADGQAHRSALEAGGHTIGVIGSGLGHVYPRENADLYARMEKRDLILSEYPYDTGVRKYHFPWRNRILAALGECIIVTEARINSGTMLTVNDALTLSKDIWCVPHPYGSEEGKGCDRLISQGAFILYAKDQLEDLMRSAV
jgi:DNA processing protein